MRVTARLIAESIVSFPNSYYEVELSDSNGDALMRCPTFPGPSFDFARAVQLLGNDIEDLVGFLAEMRIALRKIQGELNRLGVIPSSTLAHIEQLVASGFTPLVVSQSCSCCMSKEGTGTLLENGQVVYRGPLASVFLNGCRVYTGPYTPLEGTDYVFEAQKHAVKVDSPEWLESYVNAGLHCLRQAEQKRG